MLFLVQDGITNGAIYALLGLALVLVFAVTRVILIPQGEFVTYGALTYASLASGQMPGTAKLALAMGFVAFALDLFVARKSLHGRLIARTFITNIVLPAPPPLTTVCPAPAPINEIDPTIDTRSLYVPAATLTVSPAAACETA